MTCYALGGLDHGYYKLWIGDSLYIMQTITCSEASSGGSRHQVPHKSCTNLVSYTELACDRDWKP